MSIRKALAAVVLALAASSGGLFLETGQAQASPKLPLCSTQACDHVYNVCVFVGQSWAKCYASGGICTEQGCY